MLGYLDHLDLILITVSLTLTCIGYMGKIDMNLYVENKKYRFFKLRTWILRPCTYYIHG